ncbi:hypothetical protein F4677DRAFT_421929 [Hypoxylon crocopeplum]|nr:hypothetical protein F4677DRAFT_421929 [Hypoxylon crocopeplum]
MFDSYRQLSRLLASWSLLASFLSWRTAVQAIEFPTTAEVHLIYPRNDTYAPTTLMPIVFAIQNSQLAAPLDLNIQWDIYQIGVYDGLVASGVLLLTGVDFSNNSDPYFKFTSTAKLNVTEAAWMLMWTLSSGNCSIGSEGDDGWTDNLSYYNRVMVAHFTTKNGTKEPDLVAATAVDNGVCASNTQGYFTFNVTGTLHVSDPRKYDGRDTCAILAPPEPTVSANATACGPSIDASAASSISAAITSRACKALNPVVTCRPDHTSGVAGGKRAKFQAEEMIWLKITVFSILVYSLVL